MEHWGTYIQGDYRALILGYVVDWGTYIQGDYRTLILGYVVDWGTYIQGDYRTLILGWNTGLHIYRVTIGPSYWGTW